MHDFFVQLLDLVFPPQSEESFVRRLEPADVICEYRYLTSNGIGSLTSFTSPTMRALIHEAKFESNTRAQELLSLLLVMHGEQHPELKSAHWVPVPLSPARLRARGYNQVLEVLTHTSYMTAQPLTRVRDTKPQTNLARAERLTNMDGAFVCTHPEYVRGRHIVLIDDVTTTGATLRVACAALLPHTPASITCIALAH